MMISPGTYYELYLKGKNAKQIMTIIRSLKREISRLKNIMEHPEYQCMMHPSEAVRISCNRYYLDRAKQALSEAGGVYTPTKAELKAQQFNDNIPYIEKVEFSIGGFFDGHEKRIYTIEGDVVNTYIEHSLMLKPSNFDDAEIEKMTKDDFLDGIADLHIGEWDRNYSPRRFGYEVLDGTQWHLYIYFSNGSRTVKIEGSNAYPYNFDELKELFEVEI
jgi:hypothetical protein